MRALILQYPITVEKTRPQVVTSVVYSGGRTFHVTDLSVATAVFLSDESHKSRFFGEAVFRRVTYNHRHFQFNRLTNSEQLEY
jgi:hypothetical protein